MHIIAFIIVALFAAALLHVAYSRYQQKRLETEFDREYNKMQRLLGYRLCVAGTSGTGKYGSPAAMKRMYKERT